MINKRMVEKLNLDFSILTTDTNPPRITNLSVHVYRESDARLWECASELKSAAICLICFVGYV